MSSSIIIFEPDAISKTEGHYYNWSNNLIREARRKTINSIIFSNKKKQFAFDEADIDMPILTRNSWHYNLEKNDLNTNEITEIISYISNLQFTKKIDYFYFYLGSLRFLNYFMKLINLFSSIKFYVKIFWDYNKDLNKELSLPFFKKKIPSNVIICSHSSMLRKNIKDKFGIEIRRDINPFCTYDYSETKHLLNQEYCNDFVNLMYVPELTKKEKTSNLIFDLISDENYHILLKNNQNHEIIQNKTNIITFSSYSNFNYIKEISKASIFLILYQSKEFKYRTSGILLDSLFCNKPSIVLKNTQLERFVNKYNSGIAINENIYELTLAIHQIKHNYKYWLKNCEIAKKKYFNNNNFNKLFDQIINF